MPSRTRPALTSAAVLAAVTSVGLLAPAASAAPKLPANCTFNQATGTTTCVTTVQVNKGEAVSDDPYGASSDPIHDGSLAAQFCLAAHSDSSSYYPAYGEPAYIDAVGTRTTTTTYQGASAGNGNKPTSTITHSIITYTVDPDRTALGLTCFVPLDPSINSHTTYIYYRYSSVIADTTTTS